ncbi:hypothetical protein ACFQL1_22900 [Halomicroarcula sp. GCM10025709]|uniref:hypothetical protein n=1 Tax=Haloarcula TaxID=2237 RepID=UPI0024C413E4|nr:hypothetical protein [Halomicroarcula sp. YJ-61-S]
MGIAQRYGIFERGEVGFDTGRMSWAHWLAGGLAAITGGIHLYLYLEQGFPAFLFAALVFFGAIVALLLNLYRRLLYLLGIPFTAGQIVLWAAQGMPDMSIALVDKPVQVLLILLLVYLFLNEDALVRQ